MNQHRPPNDEDSNHNKNQGRHGLNSSNQGSSDDDDSTVESALKARRRRSDHSPPQSILSTASMSTLGTTSLASLTPRNNRRNRLPPSVLHPHHHGTLHHPAFAASTKTPPSFQSSHTTIQPQQQQQQRRSSMTSDRDLVRLRRQVQALLLVVVASVGMFLWFCLPVMGLVALALLGGSLGGTGVMVYRWGQAWVQYALQHGGGVFQYLPPSIQTALTETTLHEWMIDDTAALEYRFLMLYFIPGLSPAQIDSLVNRLPSRHRNILRRPGLGHLLFNDQTMSNLLGNSTPSLASQPPITRPLSIMDEHNNALLLEDDPRDDVGGADATNDLDWGEEDEDDRVPMRSFTAGEVTAQTTSTTPATTTTSTTAGTRPQLQRHEDNHLEEDDHSELGLSVSAETAVGQPSRQRRRRRTHSVGGASSRSLLTGLVPDFDFTDEVEQEGDVLSDAMTVAVTSMISTAASTMLQGLDTVVDTVLAPALIRAGTSLSVIAAGVGVWRFQLLTPNAQTNTRPSQQWMYGWIGTMVVGGATAGGMMLARRAIRRAAQASRAATNTDDDIDDEASTQKDLNASTKEESPYMHKKK